jgi:hypothetical protein
VRHVPSSRLPDEARRQRHARFQGKKNRRAGGTKRNTVSLAFIAVSRSRRPVLMIKKIAVTASVSGKKYALLPGGTAAPESCLLSFWRKKARSLGRAEQNVHTLRQTHRLQQKSGARVQHGKISGVPQAGNAPGSKKKAPPGREEPKYGTHQSGNVHGPPARHPLIIGMSGPDISAAGTIFSVPARMLYLP